RKQGLALITAESGRQLFNARVDSAMNALEWKEVAERFRSGGQAGINTQLANTLRTNADRSERELQGYRDAATRLRQAGRPVTFAVNEQARMEYIARRRSFADRLNN